VTHHLTRKRTAIAAIAIAALAGGGVIAVAATRDGQPRAFDRPQTAKDALPDSAVRFLHPGESRRVAQFTTSAGAARAVFVNRSSDTSQICIWDTDVASGEQAGGCNPAGDVFSGHAFTMSLAYDGGPAVTAVREARIVGLVTDAVASVEVAYSNGTTRRALISRDRAFVHVVPPLLLRKGVGPIAVIARSTAGAVIDRQATGIG
jgi:hypothetical protein